MSATIQPIPSSTRETWRALARAGGMVVAYIFSLAAASLPVAIGYFMFGLLVNREEPREISLHLEDALLWLNAAAAMLTLLATFVFVLLALRWLDRSGSLRALGFAGIKNASTACVAAAGAAIVLIGVVYAILNALGLARATELLWQREGWLDVFGDFFGMLLLIGSAVLVEELVFRGYIRFTLTGALGARDALLVSALLFALLRVFGGLIARLDPAELVLVGVTGFVAGLALGGLFLISQSLWAPIAAHFAWSFVGGFVLSLPVAGTPGEGLIGTQLAAGVVTGGNFGPEGGLIGLAVLAGAAILVGAAARTRI